MREVVRLLGHVGLDGADALLVVVDLVRQEVRLVRHVGLEGVDALLVDQGVVQGAGDLVALPVRLLLEELRLLLEELRLLLEALCDDRE